MDVVPANKASWRTDPLSGEIKDGNLYGRGALDTKSSGILHLAAFIALHRSKTPLNRDVIFMATADEEAGGFFGVGWLVKHRPELFKGVGYVLNEGGEGRVRGGQTLFSIEVTQKVPYWLRLTSRGEPGHGSTPRPESAVTALIAALERLASTPVRTTHRPGRRRLLQGHRAGRRAEMARALRRHRHRGSDARRGGGVPARRPDAAHAGPQHLLDHPAWRQREDQRRAAGSLGGDRLPPAAGSGPGPVSGRARTRARRWHPGRDDHGVHAGGLLDRYRAVSRPGGGVPQALPRTRPWCPPCSAASPTVIFSATWASPPMASSQWSSPSRMREACTATTSASRSRTCAEA